MDKEEERRFNALTKYLGKTQKEIYFSLKEGLNVEEISEKYGWSNVYPTLQTLKALGLIWFEGAINWSNQKAEIIIG